MGVEIIRADVASSLPGAFTPSDYGLLAWNYDPQLGDGTNTLVSGTLCVVRVPVTRTMLVTNIHMDVSSGGATFTSSAVALHSEDTTKLSESASLNAVLNSSGNKTIPLAAAQTVPGGPGRYVLVSILVVASSMPQVYRMANLAGGWAAHINGSLASPGMRVSTGGTGLSAIPSTFTQTAATNCPWIGLS